MGMFTFKLYHSHYNINTYFPNEKEISESVGAFMAAMKVASEYRMNSNVNCYIPGDGRSPRTGVIFATNTTWNVMSIDPIMSKSYSGKGKLTTFKCKAEDFVIPDDNVDLSIVVSVHGHFDHDEFYSRIPGNKILISIPCCFESSQLLSYDCTDNYIDDLILSQKNHVYIYGQKPSASTSAAGSS
jgi:hypothetical protein